jgi:LysM repeat protein
MRQLQKQFSRTGKTSPAHDEREVIPLASGSAIRKGQKAMQVPTQRNQPSEFPQTSPVAPTAAAVMPAPANRKSLSEVEQSMAPTKYVSIKPGDTLWSIAQKYRVAVEHLRTLNQLTDNRIIIGQALWLSDDRPMSEVGADKGAQIP